jgi:homoserine kinase
VQVLHDRLVVGTSAPGDSGKPSPTRIITRSVRAFAPATVANIGPGFDVLGLALQGKGDTVVAERIDGNELRILEITGDGGRLPLDAATNTAGIAAAHTLRLAGLQLGIGLRVHKGMPIGSGLGSSAASAAAAAMAVNLLLGSPLPRLQLISACVEAETAVAGRHADNVAPAILGGLIMVRGVDPLDIQRLPVPEGLLVVVVTPDFELSTRLAREALPATIPLSAMVANSANIASLVTACYAGDLAALAGCVVDNVVTPARAALIPGAIEVIKAAGHAGALASSISGSGPSIFALCDSLRTAEQTGRAMQAAFARAGLASDALISSADCPGASRA